MIGELFGGKPLRQVVSQARAGGLVNFAVALPFAAASLALLAVGFVAAAAAVLIVVAAYYSFSASYRLDAMYLIAAAIAFAAVTYFAAAVAYLAACHASQGMPRKKASR
ncbi:MAG: hypothetical protein AABW54_04795 [Candidatus Micrarchaeota archaeon]